MQARQKPEQITDLPEFKPAWWLKNCHLQTIMAKYLAPKKPLPHQTELLQLPDGDELMLCFGQTPPAKAQALVVLLHGLEGNIHSHYVRGMLHSLQQQGFAAVLMHFRGCHGQANKLPRAYHSGDTEDLSFVLHTLKARYPGVPLAAVGFSLGGNVLMKYCGETAKHCPLYAAAAVSAPLQLSASADRINRGFSKVYQRYLLNRLKATMQRKLNRHADFPLAIRADDIQRLQSIREFDQQLTAPLHGFADAEDYYRRSSAKAYLRTIARPHLLIHAKDDPFLAAEAIPTAEELSPYSQLLLSEYGGHVGFVSGAIPGQPRYWLDQVIPAFFQQHLP